MTFVEKWTAVLTRPKETFAAEKASASFGEGTKHLAIGYAVYGLVIGVLMAFVPSLFPKIPGTQAAGVMAIITTPIIYVIMGIIGTAIGTGVLWVIAKLLGGQGSFTQMYYLGALYAAPLTILQVASVIPVAGGLIVLLILIYMLYLLTLMLKEVHGFGTGKAVAVWLVPLVIIFVLLLVIMGAAMMVYLGGLGAAGKPA